MEPIDLRTAYFFSSGVRVAGIVFAIAGFPIAVTNIFIGIGLIIVGVFIVTSQYRISIDVKTHTCFDYSWILGFTWGERTQFDHVQYIYINKNKVVQRVNSRVSSTQYERYDYNGYLKFSETKKIHLGSYTDKGSLVRQMQFLASKLNCGVVDRTED